MPDNDFLGSIADERVVTVTQILKTAIVGDNYYKLMVFIEGATNAGSFSSRFITPAGLPLFQQYPGKSFSIASVDATTYALYTDGLLKSWLYDFFASQHAYEAILVACMPSLTNQAAYDAVDTALLKDAYDTLKAYAYHKTSCIVTDDKPTEVVPLTASDLAGFCYLDKELLSAAPYFQYSTLTPLDPTSDPLYVALTNEDTEDAFVRAYQDPLRNASLFQLGMTLSVINQSGTPVGNSVDYVPSGLIGSSGVSGLNLERPIRQFLDSKNIGYYMPVGDNTGDVDGVGTLTLKGNVMQAVWIVAYISYMTKVQIARYMSVINRLRTDTSYQGILRILQRNIDLFVASGRLRDVIISVPDFDDLPPAKGDEIIIPDAWSATYTDQIHSVRITGTLTISA